MKIAISKVKGNKPLFVSFVLSLLVHWIFLTGIIKKKQDFKPEIEDILNVSLESNYPKFAGDKCQKKRREQLPSKKLQIKKYRIKRKSHKLKVKETKKTKGNRDLNSRRKKNKKVCRNPAVKKLKANNDEYLLNNRKDTNSLNTKRMRQQDKTLRSQISYSRPIPRFFQRKGTTGIKRSERRDLEKVLQKVDKKIQEENYIQKVLKKIEKNKFYPYIARLNEEEGKVKIKITIGKSGELKKFKILESSGYIHLDRAAVKTVKRALPFPKPPSEREETIDVIINFRLEN